MNVDLYSIMEFFDDIHISYEEICEAERRTSLNSLISEYFYRLFEDTSLWSLFGESERIRDCSKIWRIDNYIQSHISDVKFVSHCRSKWCLHCQKLLQASRLNRFMPLLHEASKTHDLCHVVFTFPNVSGVRLKASVKLLFKSFSRLIRFFCGRDKIRGLDFSQYGFYAAMRSLEVTYGKYGEDDFHPHLHCIFAFKKGLNLEKHIVNDFSFDYGTLKTLYSDFEVFLQKLWRLIVDSERDKIYNYVAMTDLLGQPLSSTHPDYGRFVEKPKKKNKKDGAITLKALNSLKLGYSCKVDLIEDDETTNRNAFIEVFKYACKVTSEKQMLFTYYQFSSLYFALKALTLCRVMALGIVFNSMKKTKALTNFGKSLLLFFVKVKLLFLKYSIWLKSKKRLKISLLCLLLVGLFINGLRLFRIPNVRKSIRFLPAYSLTILVLKTKIIISFIMALLTSDI